MYIEDYTYYTMVHIFYIFKCYIFNTLVKITTKLLFHVLYIYIHNTIKLRLLLFMNTLYRK